MSLHPLDYRTPPALRRPQNNRYGVASIWCFCAWVGCLVISIMAVEVDGGYARLMSVVMFLSSVVLLPLGALAGACGVFDVPAPRRWAIVGLVLNTLVILLGVFGYLAHR
ncbi:MAG TPA: hypothetical protein VL282_00070 [Tepidisphaeraceae bacterium]|jgi:hypothetical protein|nr:hypothetical protein [Tepidisphaeraceae bacterium]